MKRVRPHTHKTHLNTQQKARLRRKWRSWIRKIADDLETQLLDNEVYRELAEVVEANPDIRTPGDIHDWMTANYAAAASLGVRRFADLDRRSISLWRLLYEMLEYPGVMTRTAHRALYKTSSFGADRTFNAYAGPNHCVIEPSVIRRDLRCLEDTAERLRRFVNKRVAHVAPQGAIRKLPTFQELEEVLSIIEKIVKKYHTLLTGSSPVDFKPTRQYYWRSVFFHPWIPPGSPLRAGLE